MQQPSLRAEPGQQAAPAIAVTARSQSRFARLSLRRSDSRPRSWCTWIRAAYPDRNAHPQYDAALALKLLAGTGELPARKHDLIVLLTEYRHALHALATQATAPQQPDR